MKLNKRWLALSTSLLLIAAFQNCSKVQVASDAAVRSSGDGGDPTPPPDGGGDDNPVPAGDYTATFKFKPSSKKQISYLSSTIRNRCFQTVSILPRA